MSDKRKKSFRRELPIADLESQSPYLMKCLLLCDNTVWGNISLVMTVWFNAIILEIIGLIFLSWVPLFKSYVKCYFKLQSKNR